MISDWHIFFYNKVHRQKTYNSKSKTSLSFKKSTLKLKYKKEKIEKKLFKRYAIYHSIINISIYAFNSLKNYSKSSKLLVQVKKL